MFSNSCISSVSRGTRKDVKLNACMFMKFVCILAKMTKLTNALLAMLDAILFYTMMPL